MGGSYIQLLLFLGTAKTTGILRMVTYLALWRDSDFILGWLILKLQKFLKPY